MQQWMSLLWLLCIAMFIAKQETNGLKSCRSHIKMIWSQNISWGHLRSFNLIGPACWNYSKMVRIWAISDPRKHHSNAICNVRGVEKMSPRGVGEGNHLFKKSYEGLISRLEGSLGRETVGGSYPLLIPPPPFLHDSLSKAMNVQLKTATKKSLEEPERNDAMNGWRSREWRGFNTKSLFALGTLEAAFCVCLSRRPVFLWANS